MKIVHIIPDFFPAMGGGQICVDQLARQQVLSGHDVFVLCNASSWIKYRGTFPYRMMPLPPFSALDRLLLRLGFPPKFLVRLSLRALFALTRMDVVHAHFAHSGGEIAAGLRGKIGIVLTCHGIDIQQAPSVGYGMTLNPAWNDRVRKSLQSANCVVPVSRAMIEDCTRIAGIEILPKITVIENGAAIARIQAVPSDREAIRRSLGVDGQTALALCLGRNHPKKNFAFAIETAERLLARGERFRFVCVGSGYEPLFEAAAARGLGDFFIDGGSFTADPSTGGESLPPSQQISLMKACDLLFLPSIIEGFPLVAPEALACGLPLLTTPECGIGDVFGSEVHTTFALNDADGAAAGFQELISRLKDPAFRKVCIESTRQLDWATVSARYLAAYEIAKSSYPRNA